MSLANQLRRFPAARWVHRVLMLQTAAVFLWTLATFVLGLMLGVPWPAVVPLLLAVASAWLTRCWGRLAEWVGPVLVVIEIGVLFLCAFAWLARGPALGTLVFGTIATLLLVLLSVNSGRARHAGGGVAHRRAGPP